MDDGHDWSELTRWRGERLGPIELLPEIDSTNHEALRRIDCGRAPQGLVLVARRQQGGHGSRGRAWHDVPGRSLALTAVLDWPQELPLAVATWLGAVAVGDLLAELELLSRIKWPNDLLVRERKLAGVLAETRTQPGSPTRVALGIGLNVGHAPGDFPPDLATPPTSLAIEGRLLAPPDAALRLLRRLDGWWVRVRSDGPEPIRAAFLERLDLRGRPVRAELQGRPDRPIDGPLVALEPDGTLQIGGERIPGGHVAALRAL